MRRLLKAMFSQVAVVSFLLILQILLITASLMHISDYFLYFDIFMIVIVGIFTYSEVE